MNVVTGKKTEKESLVSSSEFGTIRHDLSTSTPVGRGQIVHWLVQFRNLNTSLWFSGVGFMSSSSSLAEICLSVRLDPFITVSVNTVVSYIRFSCYNAFTFIGMCVYRHRFGEANSAHYRLAWFYGRGVGWNDWFYGPRTHWKIRLHYMWLDTKKALQNNLMD